MNSRALRISMLIVAAVTLWACTAMRKRIAVDENGRLPAAEPGQLSTNLELMLYDNNAILAIMEYLNSLYSTSWIDKSEVEKYLSGPTMIIPRTEEDKEKKFKLQKGLERLKKITAHRDSIGKTIALEVNTKPSMLEDEFFDNRRFLSRDHEPSFPLTTEPFPVAITENFFLRDLSGFKASKKGPSMVVPIDNLRYDYTLKLENFGVRTKNGVLHADLRCSKPIKVRRKWASDFNSVQEIHLEIPRVKKKFSKQVELVFPKEEISCDMSFQNPEDKSGFYGVKFVSDENLFGQDLGRKIREVCAYQKEEQPKNPLDLFLNVHGRLSGCALSPESSKFISDPVDGFLKKVEMLTGQVIPRDVVESQDREYQLDMSKAPKLDLILMSYFEYRADYSGHLLSQALLHHASRGTQVRIILPGLFGSPTVSPVDLDLLHSMMETNPNIRLQRYWTEYERDDLVDIINHQQRALHTKIFITLSRSDKEANSVLVGGRNVKDTFIFRKMPNYAGVPGYTQYGPKEPYIFMEDAEFFLKGSEVTQQAAAMLLSFYNRNQSDMRMRPVTEHLRVLDLPTGRLDVLKNLLRTQTYVRPVLSVPFLDGYQLEDLLVTMLNSAQKSVRIITPYFNPTKKLRKAFIAAAERGIKIEIIAPLKLKGDNSPTVILEDVNKASFNLLVEKADLYQWTAPSILHAKTISIDDEVLFVGGVNLNRRSMAHDAENGYLVTGQEAIAEYNKAFEQYYLASAEKVDEKLKLKFFLQLLIKLLDPTNVL